YLTAALLIGSMYPLMLMAQNPETASTGGVLGNSVWETIEKGGTVMYVILGASIIGLMFMLDVAFRTRRGNILPRHIEAQLTAHDKELPLDELIENDRIVVNRTLMRSATPSPRRSTTVCGGSNRRRGLWASSPASRRCWGCSARSSASSRRSKWSPASHRWASTRPSWRAVSARRC
ncbi:MAG: hypothetical protein QGF67_18175, partial [Lentisphaeria bacterium]|nr:hypothetical protein [Lentisphaeria bacterium]